MSSLLVDIDRLATYDAEGVAPYIIGKKEISTSPYTFRQGLGTMADMEIVGGTVAWNQLINRKSYSNGSNTDSRTSVYFRAQFIGKSIDLVNETISENGVYEYVRKVQTDGDLRLKHSGSTSDLIFAAATSALTVNHVVFLSIAFNGTNPSVTEGVKTDNMQVIDLTQVFGTEIADYIYSLEQTNEGDGVAWFRKLFPADYYPYDAGSLKSVEGLQSRDVIGFNQWDEEWEIGRINSTTGENQSATDRIRSKNYISSSPNTNYFFAGPYSGMVLYYGSNKQYLGNTDLGSVGNKPFSTIDGTRYIRFFVSSNYSTTYNHDICINLSDPAKNGTYEPYHGHSYPLDSSLTLRGIPKLDSNNKLYYDGDIYRADGSVERKYGIVDLGTLNWILTGSGNFTAQIQDIKRSDLDVQICICQKYSYNNTTSVIDKTYWNNVGVAYGEIYIRDTSYSDAATFKTAMSGVYLVYELETPTTESAKPFQNPQRAYPDATEEFTDGLTRDVMVPVGNNTTYQLSKGLIPAEDYTDGAVEILEDSIETKADILAIAPNEPGTTASQAYSTGDHFYKDGKFCTAITSISSGATFTKNTNYREEDGGATSAMNNYRSKKLTATVSSTSLAFTDTLISNSATIIDGPYIADVMVGVTAATISNNTVTFTLDSSSANGKSAYIWLRY